TKYGPEPTKTFTPSSPKVTTLTVRTVGVPAPRPSVTTDVTSTPVSLLNEKLPYTWTNSARSISTEPVTVSSRLASTSGITSGISPSALPKNVVQSSLSR